MHKLSQLKLALYTLWKQAVKSMQWYIQTDTTGNYRATNCPLFIQTTHAKSENMSLNSFELLKITILRCSFFF